MAQYYQQQAMTGTYPPPLSAPYEAAAQRPYVTAPPQMGYPVKDQPMGYPETAPPPYHQTQNKGLGGCLQGCLAALCCCWVLDCIF
ncbi:PREDICTED: cysteine-rich and transmembrane domain-containing protein B [Tarenaya hassleriana]|uniref:cysteine-rich and transmembrane domain-containing protein B n=1 Tax=Tarenaya hassleriana TaxID=28532 RepID=UPI00053C61E4|nr:PREDICTED: cysteine-rich and transmembrane domain-containing protein B [Tarenaya hassleriana]